MGSIGFLVFSKIYVVVLGVLRGPNGFAASWRFKMLDSQPDSSTMGPVPTGSHDFRDFQKSHHALLPS